jgi:iron complex transport system permease protein
VTAAVQPPPVRDAVAGRPEAVRPDRGPGRGALVLGGLAAAAVVAVGRGAVAIPPDDVVAILLGRGGAVDAGGIPVGDVVWQIRLPRVVLGVLVGAALGAAGALLQGMFGNPLAEPGTIGVSAGAAVGGVTAIAAGATAAGPWVLPAAAFAGGLATTLLVYAGSRSGGRVETVTLILTGIAVNAMAGAAIGLALFLSDDAELRSITFWTLGSLATATWRSVALVAPLVLLGLASSAAFARPLDLLATGEGPARHLGVDVDRLRLRLVVVVAVLTAAGVAVAGVIGFVGLVVPHLVRVVTGPGHRLLLPASALGGALVLALGDLLARTVAVPAEVPLGVLTALVGAPAFLHLLRRTRERQGGWA